MCGSATLTIEESIAPISVPNVIETVTSHLLGFGRATRRAVGGAVSEGLIAVAIVDRPEFYTPAAELRCTGEPTGFPAFLSPEPGRAEIAVVKRPFRSRIAKVHAGASQVLGIASSTAWHGTRIS